MLKPKENQRAGNNQQKSPEKNFNSLKIYRLIIIILAFLALSIGITGFAQTIVIPAEATKFELKAGQELIEHLGKAVGHKILLKKEGQVVKGPAIYVGKTEFAGKKGIKFDDFGKEEWLIKSVGEDLIVGGGQPSGGIYGVWELLERQFGVLWLDELFTWIPPVSEIKWPANLNWRGKPAFEVRGIYAYFRNPHENRQRFMARNRQNFFHDEGGFECPKQWGVFRTIGSPRSCHTYYNYTKDWGPEHEDCFSLSEKGKRLRAVNPGGPGQVCFSNPKTRQLFAAKLRGFIQKDRMNTSLLPNEDYPLIYDISANDNSQKCVCPECLAAAKKYGAYSGLVLEFTNAIADSIARDYPDIKVQMFAYQFAQEPPENIKARPNVLIRIAQLGMDFSDVGGIRDSLRPLSHPNNKKVKQQICDWAKVGTMSIWDYWIMFIHSNFIQSYQPNVEFVKGVEASTCIKAITENLLFYRNQNVQFVFAEVEKPLRTCFYALRLWIGLRFMNNPDLNVAEQVDLFMKHYYGPAANSMKMLLKYIEQRNSEIKENLTDIPLKQRVDLDDAFFAKANELLREAEASVASKPDYLRRIAKERTIIDHVRLARRAELQPFDQEAIMKRLEKNYRIACEDYLTKGIGVQNGMKDLQLFFDGLRLNVPVPEEFKNVEIMADLTWPRMKLSNGTSLIDDPDAAGGKAIIRKDKNATGKLEFGFYDIRNRKFIHTVTVKRQLLPQDEQFHFYPIGKATLTPRCYVWADWTWLIQCNLSDFYNSKGANDYEIFISIKVQGPAYVTGSKKENAIIVDRILLIRPKQGKASLSD